MLQVWFDNCNALAESEAGVARVGVLVLAVLRSRSRIAGRIWEIARLRKWVA